MVMSRTLFSMATMSAHVSTAGLYRPARAGRGSAGAARGGGRTGVHLPGLDVEDNGGLGDVHLALGSLGGELLLGPPLDLGQVLRVVLVVGAEEVEVVVVVTTLGSGGGGGRLLGSLAGGEGGPLLLGEGLDVVEPAAEVRELGRGGLAELLQELEVLVAGLEAAAAASALVARAAAPPAACCTPARQ